MPENFFYVGNASVKRHFLREAGRLDERFQYHAWDDFELGQRLIKLGMKASFIPQAAAEHMHAISLRPLPHHDASRGIRPFIRAAAWRSTRSSSPLQPQAPCSRMVLPLL